MIMAAALGFALIGGLLASSQCPPGDYRCQSLEQALRYTAYAGGMAGILSAIKLAEAGLTDTAGPLAAWFP